MKDTSPTAVADPQEIPSTGERIPQVSIGLFGPRRVVRTMSEVGQQVADRYGPNRIKFVGGGHDDPSEAEEKYQRLKGRIDAAVFPGPWLFDLATGEHWLTVPTTHIPLTGAALYAALLRASLTIEQVDLARVSIDSLAEVAVEEAYAEIGLKTTVVRCRPYDGPESVSGFVDFHREQWEQGDSTLALTTILSVEKELRAIGVPVMSVTPTRSTVRDAIETAVLLGQGTRLGSHQIAMIAVQLIPAAISTAEATDYWQQELALSTQQRLLAEARHVGATVTRRSDTLFLVTTTYGGLEKLTDQFRTAPFMNGISSQLGVPVAVGIGGGNTARAAEANALTAVEDSAGRDSEAAVYLDDSGIRSELRPRDRDVAEAKGTDAPAASAPPRAMLIMSTVAATGLSKQGQQQTVVDVDDVAAAMQVTQRTARRMLKELVQAGLAWPLPPVRSTNGRPRQQFRLLVEKVV